VPALRILQKEGFQPSDEVDIFDSGPLVRAARENIRTIKRSRLSSLEEIVPALEKQDSTIVAHAALDFRACLGGIEFTATGGCRLASETAERLRVIPGAKIIAAPFGRAETVLAT
jgi:arginine N-succinyltransferase